MRGVVLLAILVMLAVTLTPTLRSLIRQQSAIAALQDKVVAQRAHVEALRNEQARWDDPAYVEQQARERLKFVRVGDRSYTVIDGSGASSSGAAAAAKARIPAGATVAAPQASTTDPWYGQLWQSVKLADRPSAGLSPVPDVPAR